MQREHGAIEMLERAVGLLRSAPAATLVIYLIGAIPFTVGLMFFLVDMTHSPFAFEHLSQASLAMALLYVWKHAWKAVFCARLHRELAPPPERTGNLWRTISIQAGLQSLKLILPFFPLPWLSAFFRNLALFAGLGAPHPVRTAGRQAVLWPRQNFVILLMNSLAFLLLFVNVLVLLIALPQLGRTFLGIEGDLARLGAGLLNWITIFIAAALTWLVIDPLLDAVYVLRCFYGESVTSGEDLRAALRNATIAATLIVACFLLQPAVRAQDALPQPATSVDAARLDNSIQEVIHRREFTWRVPLAQSAKDDSRVMSWYRSFLETLGNLWDWIVQRIEDWFRNRQTSESNGNGAAVTRRQLEVLIAIVVALIAAAAAIFFFRGKRRPVVAAQAVQGATPAIDLADESLTADQLPEDSWWKLADELRAKGEHRLAIRALYLAGINHLAGRGLVSVRRWKTGLEYRRELDRRARATPGLPPVFANGVALFEQGWYGHHAVDQPLVDALMASIRELRSHGQSQ